MPALTRFELRPWGALCTLRTYHSCELACVFAAGAHGSKLHPGRGGGGDRLLYLHAWSGERLVARSWPALGCSTIGPVRVHGERSYLTLKSAHALPLPNSLISSLTEPCSALLAPPPCVTCSLRALQVGDVASKFPGVESSGAGEVVLTLANYEPLKGARTAVDGIGDELPAPQPQIDASDAERIASSYGVLYGDRESEGAGYITFDVGGSAGVPRARFIYVTNPFFLLLDPAILKFLTAGVLMPDVYREEVSECSSAMPPLTLASSPCPHHHKSPLLLTIPSPHHHPLSSSPCPLRFAGALHRLLLRPRRRRPDGPRRTERDSLRYGNTDHSGSSLR